MTTYKKGEVIRFDEVRYSGYDPLEAYTVLEDFNLEQEFEEWNGKVKGRFNEFLMGRFLLRN